jgi:uncharacterized protein
LGEKVTMSNFNFVVINEITLTTDKDSGNIVILKKEKESAASLTMFIGEAEFLAIAKEKQLIQPPRPLTHELYLTILAETDVEFLGVEIYDLKEQAYLARVIYKKDGVERTAEARPSDALALALNKNLPIQVHPKLLKREFSTQQIEIFHSFIKSVKF